MNIKYKIKFFSYWHCGSGLSAGAYTDTLVVKDRNKLPYVPGKTIKGLIRETAEEILSIRKSDTSILTPIFGSEGDIQGCAFFQNATLSKLEQSSIANNNLSSYMYKSISFTKIDKNGITVDNSLHSIEVVVPCELEGEIIDIPEEQVNLICDSLKFIKRMGVNRNRGLGQCQISIERGDSV